MSETSFIRTKKDRNYTVIDNTFLKDERLSAGAKGLFAYLLYLPEDWVIYQSELTKHFSNGKDSIRSIISELEFFGYIIKEKVKSSNGKFAGYNFVIVETPCRENRGGKTAAENPTSENPPLLNTNIYQVLNKPTTVVPSEPFPEDPTKVKEEKKSFKKTDYSECISLINSCKNTLSSKGKFVDKTEFRIPAVNKWLKQWFTEYGVEATKKGIVNAMSFKFVTDNGFKLSILFSDKIFPQCVSNSFTNYSSYSNKQSLVGSEFDKSHENTVFNHDDEGAWK